MSKLNHMAICTKNNRRLARFYNIVFGMEEVWNEEQNSAYAYYLGDGYFNLNCLQIFSESGRVKIIDGRKILPEPGINHVGFTVTSIDEIRKRLSEVTPPIQITPSIKDGRYEEYRFDDPEGNPMEIAGWWDAGTGKGEQFPKIAHVGVGAKDLDHLAEFYKFIFSMKEVERVNGDAVYLSDGTLTLALVKNSPIPKSGIQLLGFKVRSLPEIEARLKETQRAYTYKGEQPIAFQSNPIGSYKGVWLKDPDGNYVGLSEEGWPL